MDVLKDLALLRDHYYSVYLTKLQKKVAKQRKEIAEKESAIKARLLQEEIEKAKKAHQFVQRLPKITLTNDVKYLQKVPKSHYYHLVGVEDLLKSRGHLKHKFEIDDFWRKAKADKNLWAKPIPASISPDRLTEHMLSRYSSSSTHAQLDQSISHQQNPNRQPDGILKKPMDVDDSERPKERLETDFPVFPEQPKFPKLHSFDSKLSQLHPKSSISNTSSHSSQRSSTRSNFELKPARKGRRHVTHQLKRQAYDVAVVNTAMSGRLLHRHGLNLDEHQPISEIWCGQSETNSTFSVQTSTSKKKGRLITKPKNIPIDTQPFNDTNTQSLSQVKKSIPNEEHAPFHEDVSSPLSGSEIIPQSLSMDMLLSNENLPVKALKSSSKLWFNYADVEEKGNLPIIRE